MLATEFIVKREGPGGSKSETVPFWKYRHEDKDRAESTSTLSQPVIPMVNLSQAIHIP